MSKLAIGFFSSSDFTIPIIEDIYKNHSRPLKELVAFQFQDLSQRGYSGDLERFFGSEFLTKTIHTFSDDLTINLSVIVSQPDRQHRSKIISNPISQWARDHSISLFTPEKLNKAVDEFKNYSLDIGVVASYGQILSESILTSTKYGFLNWHPSFLPHYRGATPMQSTLKNGDTQSALSWIEMTREMDAGDILLQLPTPVEENLTFKELASKMGMLGYHSWALAIAAKLLPQLQASRITQDHTQATFCTMLKKEDKLVDPLEMSAREIFNHFRAMILFPGTVFKDNNYFSQEIKILGAFPEDNHPAFDHVEYEDETWVQAKVLGKKEIYLKCRESLLCVSRIGLENGKKIDFSGFQFR